MLKKIIIFITVLIFAITAYSQTAMDYYNLAKQAGKIETGKELPGFLEVRLRDQLAEDILYLENYEG